MKIVEVEIALEDRATGDIAALVIVYTTALGVESSLRIFPNSPVPVEASLEAIEQALKSAKENRRLARPPRLPT